MKKDNLEKLIDQMKRDMIVVGLCMLLLLTLALIEALIQNWYHAFFLLGLTFIAQYQTNHLVEQRNRALLYLMKEED